VALCAANVSNEQPRIVSVIDQQDDLATLGAIGALAAMTAALAHEAVGHAGACVMSGGEIQLLSVIWFRCSAPSMIIDLAGPLSGLAVGLGGLALGRWGPSSAVRARLFGLLMGSLAAFWFSAQLTTQIWSGLDDWRVAANWPWIWRAGGILTGVGCYVITMRVARSLAGKIGRGRSAWRRFLVPYAAGALTLVACASLRQSDGSVLETFRAIVLAPLGWLWAVTRATVPDGEPRLIVRSSWAWIASGLAAIALFAAVFGQGIGSSA
jgi:hypothetical protein